MTIGRERRGEKWLLEGTYLSECLMVQLAKGEKERERERERGERENSGMMCVCVHMVVVVASVVPLLSHTTHDAAVLPSQLPLQLCCMCVFCVHCSCCLRESGCCIER